MAIEINQARTTVQYRVSLIGSIQSHLAGLQGYDVMALELIQNADDAHATDLIFDIRSDGLYVENSGQFSYCGNLADETCSHAAHEGNSCDFHRISPLVVLDIASCLGSVALLSRW